MQQVAFRGIPMLLDWLTLRLPRSHIPAMLRIALESHFGHVISVDKHGEVVWKTCSREKVRSDTHQTTIRLIKDMSPKKASQRIFTCRPDYDRWDYLEIAGSPARVLSADNVFGSPDIRYCFASMVRHVNNTLGCTLPVKPELYDVTRTDITENYFLHPDEIREALRCMSMANGGHYRQQNYGLTSYWNKSSRKRASKAYHKGPHLKYLSKKEDSITEEMIILANHLLRLELKLGSQWWREVSKKEWHLYNPNELIDEHRKYFSKLIGEIEVNDMDTELRKQIINAAKTEGQGLSAFRTWSLIKSIGTEEARASMNKRAWYHHTSILKNAGLSIADINAGKILPFRKKTIELGKTVDSWDELKKLVSA